MPNRLRLRPEAESDLDAIATFSMQNFGPLQAARFREAFLKALDLLPVFPNMGNAYPLREGLRRFVHESHSIYYRIEGEQIVVIRILGPGQDPAREFEP